MRPNGSERANGQMTPDLFAGNDGGDHRAGALGAGRRSVSDFE
jgi:hypothetical protein